MDFLLKKDKREKGSFRIISMTQTYLKLLQTITLLLLLFLLKISLIIVIIMKDSSILLKKWLYLMTGLKEAAHKIKDK
jgi:hypothetical protein